MEANGGVAIIPNSLTESAQNKYRASLSGYVYSFGVVRFHANGSPSYSLVYSGTTIDGDATDVRSNLSYSGNANIDGFMATKYVNFVARPRFSIGLGFGAGIAPQLKADYSRTAPTAGQQKQYVLKEVPVTPLFEFQIRGEVRVLHNLSVGPFGGIRNGLPVAGGAVRVHFLK